MDPSLSSCVLFFLLVFSFAAAARRNKRPNIIIMFADDLGYGDLQVYGHPTSSTPNLNRMAAGGKVFTQFYAAAAICSPSRAALLTGRYHMRSGIYPGVFNVTSSGGLPHREVTIAEMLKARGYYTAMVGKWHLGVGRNGQYLPPSQGFDEFLGLPASHSHCPCSTCFAPNRTCLSGCKHNFSPCPLYNGTNIIEQPIDLLTLDEKYATQARKVIRRNADTGKPFFLYYSFQHTHDPPYADWRHTFSTERGDYGDALAAMDWEVGQMMEELEENDLVNDTFIFFTADNGPSLSKRWGGSVGLLKCGKATTYEGGVRVPAIAHWPGRIKPGYTMELSSALDLLPTISKVTGSRLPPVTLDGVDMAPFLFNEGKSLRETFFYYSPAANERQSSFAIRYKQYKAHFYTKGSTLSGQGHPDPDCRKTAKRTKHIPPLLYDLHRDPAEQYNIAHEPEYQDIIKEMTRIREEFDSRMHWAESELHKPSYQEYMPCCNPGCTPQPYCCHCTHSVSMAYNPWDLYTNIYDERERDRDGKASRRDGIRDKSEYYNPRAGGRRDKDAFYKEPKKGRGNERGDIFASNTVRGNMRDDSLVNGRDRTRDGNREKNRGVFDDADVTGGRNKGRVPLRDLDKPRDRSDKERDTPREKVKVSPRGRVRIHTDEGVPTGYERERGRDRPRGTEIPFGEDGQGTRRGRKNGRDNSRTDIVLDDNSLDGDIERIPAGNRRIELKDMYIDLTSLDSTEETTETYLEDVTDEGEAGEVGLVDNIREDSGGMTYIGSDPAAANPATGDTVRTHVRDYFGGFAGWDSPTHAYIQSDSLTDPRGTASTHRSMLDEGVETTTEGHSLDMPKTKRRNLKNAEKRLERQNKKDSRKGIFDENLDNDRNVQF